ncbi:MAG TPA: aspartyl/asparaginyl beta-hydroxylase domain-containing protein [Paucimonas sp.]|nr:aspartyl/asparaginyl beta-hydroxylase domain-containing protein [Paucimonas sp.]
MNDLKDQIEHAISNTPDGRKTFFDVDAFPWVKEVEACSQAIRQELDQLLSAIDLLPGFEEIQIEQHTLSTDKRWKIFPLHAYGYWVKSNERRCPETVKALKKIPNLQAAMFSILQPQKELPPHRGPYSGVLRYHLGLKIPKPESQCGICVGGDFAHWEEGKSLIFDDSHMHHAWNRSNEERVVLFVDFTRPLPSPIKEMNEQFINGIGRSMFIEGSIERWEMWEAAFGSELDRSLEQLKAASV